MHGFRKTMMTTCRGGSRTPGTGGRDRWLFAAIHNKYQYCPQYQALLACARIIIPYKIDITRHGGGSVLCTCSTGSGNAPCLPIRWEKLMGINGYVPSTAFADVITHGAVSTCPVASLKVMFSRSTHTTF